jgi:hypothetical protein
MAQPAQQQSAPNAALPKAANDDTIGIVREAAPHVPVPHTQTQSTLAPTAEFTRIFLLAWIIRYIFRGGAKVGFEPLKEGTTLTAKLTNMFSAPGRWLQRNSFGGRIPLNEMENAAYSVSLGLGSGLLSWQYSRMVRADIQNLFCETVAEEKGVAPSQVTFKDITQSDNRIIQRTVANYREKTWSRLISDSLFIFLAPLRSEGLTDLLLGGKGVQIFADTWKRKTTMFEDLVTFVNNKINPRNGLGQPISLGEVFDLYQHYTEAFAPEKMFNNVLSRNATGRWAHSQPIFQRITELMNETYAYKHTTPADYNAAARSGSDFPLPKLIDMLGHDLIDPDRPERTLALVEIMNAKGQAATRDAARAIDAGQAPTAVLAQHGLTPHAPKDEKAPEGNNGVIAKGSTMQLDTAPRAVVEKAQLQSAPLQSPEETLRQA